MDKKFWPYLISFFITVSIFVTAIYISNYFNSQRIEQVRGIEERISIDILSLETQFDLLEGLSCESLAENTVLSQELRSLAQRLTFTENSLGVNNPEVLKLKRKYSLLQIKDYLLMQKVADKCTNIEPVFIFYFYSNKGDCDDCTKTGHVLSYLEEKYPSLRVYAFDYNLELGALQTLITLNKVERDLPALIIDKEIYYGYKDRPQVEEILPTEKLSTSTPSDRI